MRRAWSVIAVLAVACGGPEGGDDGGTGGREDGAMTRPDGGGAVDGGPVDAGPPPEPEPATDLGDEGQEIWVFMQSHLHTTGYHSCADDPLDPRTGPESICYSGAGVTAFLQEALANDASDMIITDHNNIDAWFDPAFAPLADFDRTRYATPLRGTEWSSKDGHMTLLFPTRVVEDNMAAVTNGWVFAAGNDTPVSSFDDYRMTIDSVHAAGGVVMINHPELSIHAFPENSLGADGVEVGIPPNPLDDDWMSLHASAEARRYWQRRLVSGERLAGTAGADHHHGDGDIPGLDFPTFGTAVNLLRIDPALPDADVAMALGEPEVTIDRRTAIVIDAVRRGHVMVVEDRDAARVYLGADTDRDGRYHDARAGDCVLPRDFDGSEIRVRVRITNPTSATGSSHYNFEVFDHTNDTEPAWYVEVDYDTGFPVNARYDVDPSDPFAIELTLPYDPTALRFFRVVLVRDTFIVNDTEVVTNPIYYGDWGDECDGAFPLY